MREVVFKMERPGLVKEGETVDISESMTPVNVNYMIEPAVAMSGLFRFNERLKSRKGVVKEIIQNDRGYYVTVVFDEYKPDSCLYGQALRRLFVEQEQKQKITAAYKCDL